MVPSFLPEVLGLYSHDFLSTLKAEAAALHPRIAPPRGAPPRHANRGIGHDPPRQTSTPISDFQRAMLDL